METPPRLLKITATVPSLLDAIRIAKQNEKTALDFYATAAGIARNSMFKKLFEQLGEFEVMHYEILGALENSMQASGEFTNYEGKEFLLPPTLVLRTAEEPNSTTIIKVILEAVDLEPQAEHDYAALADQTADPRGHDMFTKLSEEEHKHYRILRDAYWTLSNLGEWKAPGR
jgi:rubrerythrin